MNKVYKLYTIGDCYVVLGAVNINKRNPAEQAYNVVKLAFDLVEIIKDVRTKINFNDLNMRIGVHTGTIMGGIIGTDIVRYDVFGSDVTIAN